jgi:hypothetical protein
LAFLPHNPSPTTGAPFGICCQQTALDAAVTDAGSSNGSGNSVLVRPGALQLLVLPAAAAQDSAAVGPTTPCASTEADEFRIKVAFSQVQLLLAGSAAAGASGTAAAHIKGAAATAAAAKAAGSNSSSGSNPHQQHPLGLSPPHTPTKHPEDVSSSARHSQHPSGSIDGSSSAGSSSSQAVSAVAPGASLPARQLEAMLLSHSPRMLVIDNFFSPGG